MAEHLKPLQLGRRELHFLEKLLAFLEGAMAEGHVADGTVAQGGAQAGAIWRVREGITEALGRRGAVYKYDVSLPLAGPSAALKVGFAKLLAIALACAGGFPGGIIFPLFFASSALAHSCASLLPAALLPVWVMSLMASTQASVTRTPLATIFMLGLSAAASAHLSVLLPPVIIAAYVGVWTSRLLGEATFFPYPANAD